MRNYYYKHLHWLWLSMVIIVIDQWTKNLAVANFKLHVLKPVTSFFNFTLAYNTGAAFSFLNDAGGWQRWFFIITTIIIIIGLLVWLLNLDKHDKYSVLGISLIIGGALGNLWDRIIYGYVIDFLDFHINTWHWPAFNIADSAITIGAILLLIPMIISTSKST